MRTMTENAQLKRIAGYESQGTCREDKTDLR
jgi:hypothetical protein